MNTLLNQERAATRAGLVSLDGQAYPLQSAEIEARVEGGVALSTLRQRYLNPYEERLEVVYTLPLPADGAVIGYTIQVGDRLIEGEVRSREAAAEAYKEALYEGKTAGLLEEDRADTFRQQLGNIPGRTAVAIEIQVLHPLAFRPGKRVGDRDPASSIVGAPSVISSHPGGFQRSVAEWEYRFPTTVGVRYMGGEGRVSDSDRLEPGRVQGGIPARLSASLRLAGSVPRPGVQPEVRSPTHPIELQEDEEGLCVGLTDGAPLDRDLVLRWAALPPKVGVHLVEGGGLEGDDGRYALVTILPPAQPDQTHQRDLTILLDASGSMHGRPFDTARAVTGSLLESLNPKDRIEVLAFRSQVTRVTSGMTPATPMQVAQIREALGQLAPSGGTQMGVALRRALRPLRADAQRQVVLVSDGYVGFEEEVMGEAVRHLPEGVRVHVVGVGAAPNRTLTRGLARAGGGMEIFAQDEASARESAALLRDATARPVLSGVSLSGSALLGVAPDKPRDMTADHPVTVAVELAPEGGELELSGSLAGASEPWKWSCEIPPRRDRPTAQPAETRTPLGWTPIPVGALYGREAVADLEFDLVGTSARSQVELQIEERALRHRITSRRTSLVAVSNEPTVDPRDPGRREVLPVELPAGVSAAGVGYTSMQQPEYKAAYSLRHMTSFSLIQDPSPEGSPMTELRDARVIRQEASLLVLEVKVPSPDFNLPRGRVTVQFPDGTEKRAQMDVQKSTPEGPHPVGLWVRIALRLARSEEWPDEGTIRLSWGRAGHWMGQAPDGVVIALELRSGNSPGLDR